MKRAALVVTIIFSILAFGVGFAGTTVALDVTRPVASGSTGTVNITVEPGDTSTTIADKLANAGLINNALVFRLYARYKHLDATLKQGTYQISPGMTMDQIIAAFNGAPINEDIPVTVPPALRVTQYATFFKVLPNFNATNFNQIAKTGILMDDAKTPLWTEYWFIPKPTANVKYALEGYLFPDTYQFDKKADESVVIKTMIENLGAQLGKYLCPGPNDDPTTYIFDKAQCKAHAATVGTAKTSIFTVLEKAYNTTDDTAMINTVMMLSSLTIREILKDSDAQGVNNVYYTRWLSLAGVNNLFIGGAYNMGSDPSAEYALDSVHPPSDGVWWHDQISTGAVAGKDVESADPYNSDVDGHIPPGPIAAPESVEIKAALAPGTTDKVYFVGCKGIIYYAATNDENEANNAQYCG